MDWKGEEKVATKKENEEPVFTDMSECKDKQDKSLSQTQPLHVNEF